MFRLVQIAPGAYVASSSLYLTNSVVVEGLSHNVLVIDPAVTVQELMILGVDLRQAGLKTELGFSTHPHWDHLLWIPALGNAPRYATGRAIQSLITHRDIMFSEMMQAAPGHDPTLFGQLTELPPGSETLPWTGPATQLMTHNAHAPGHAALFLAERGLLILGDMLSDVEIPLLDLTAPDPVKDYRIALSLLSKVLPHLHIFVPGHGHLGYGAREFQRRLDADMEYLDALEEGRICRDPRLEVPWLHSVHDTQWHHLHGHVQPD